MPVTVDDNTTCPRPYHWCPGKGMCGGSAIRHAGVGMLIGYARILAFLFRRFIAGRLFVTLLVDFFQNGAPQSHRRFPESKIVKCIQYFARNVVIIHR
jgi:hypothetical protein